MPRSTGPGSQTNCNWHTLLNTIANSYHQKNFPWMCVSNVLNCRIKTVGDQVSIVCPNLPSCRNVCCQICLNFILLIIVGNQNLIDVQTQWATASHAHMHSNISPWLGFINSHIRTCGVYYTAHANTSVVINTFLKSIHLFSICCNLIYYSM